MKYTASQKHAIITYYDLENVQFELN